MEQETTLQDILDVIYSFSTRVDEHFDRIERRLDEHDKHFGKIDGRLDKIENTMITKLELIDILDEKFADFRGDMTVLIRKEDKKLGEIVQTLKRRHGLTDEDVKRILGM